MVETEGTAPVGNTAEDNELCQHTVAQAPLGRIGHPQDIAPAAAFLAPPEASWITGETLYISGDLR